MTFYVTSDGLIARSKKWLSWKATKEKKLHRINFLVKYHQSGEAIITLGQNCVIKVPPELMGKRVRLKLIKVGSTKN